MLALALIGAGVGIVACLTWVYFLYGRELADYDPKIIAVVVLMLVLTGGFLLVARFAKKRIRTIGSAN